MPLTQKHKEQIIAVYCIVFYMLLLHKAWNGLLLSQLQPHLFAPRFDMLSWLVMQTGLHQWLLDNRAGCIGFDVAFYSMPLLYLMAYKKNQRASKLISVMMLVINWVYILCYTLYPANSIESFTPWLLFPFLLMPSNLRSFYFMLHGLRYFFLFFFASSAVWKFVQGGIFNAEQMSGVLLFQHKEYLVSSVGNWYTTFIYWLVNHSFFSYYLYLTATCIEASFIIGFLTKKLDRLLIAAFILFVLFDVLVMRIPYWEISPFIIALVYSKYSLPEK